MLLSHPLAAIVIVKDSDAGLKCVCWWIGSRVVGSLLPLLLPGFWDFVTLSSRSSRAPAERALQSGEQQRTGRSGGIFWGSLSSRTMLGPWQCDGLKTFRCWKTLEGFWQIWGLGQRLILHWPYSPRKKGILLCFFWILFSSLCSLLHLYKIPQRKCSK